jgi:hypothetical protein
MPDQIQFKVPGRVTSPRPPDSVPGIATFEATQSFQIRPPTRGDADYVSLESKPDALLELEFEDGTKRYIRADQFARDLETGGRTRAAEESGGVIVIPASLGGITRGDSEMLAALRLLDVSPWDPVIDQIAETGAELGARKIAAYFENKLNAGMYRITDPRELGPEITEQLPSVPEKPILLLLHGTASSTAGSFSKLAGKPEWEQFHRDYDRILALEHHTFSLSPIQNAIAAAKLLPKGASLHLLSHSRGGLVGELLCLTDIKSNQLEDFRSRLPEDAREQADELKELADLLRERQLRIERFVRVACPSRGTLLASDRVDLYFSLLLKVLEFVPALHESLPYAVFKATFLKLIQMKAEPKHLPGLEAMRPESPFIALLNRPDLSTQADLAIVAGRADGFSLSLRGLVRLASAAFYREPNDFVVNTEAMYWGMHRANGAFYFPDQGGDVSHFNYFENERTRKQIGAWLNRDAQRPPNQFIDITLRLRKDLTFPMWRGEDKRPVLICIPPALGTYLKDQRGRVWLELPGLLPGDLDSLTHLDRLSIDGVIPRRSRRLLESLDGSFSIVPFDYDWRKPLEDSANALADRIRAESKKLKDSGRALSILAISSGAMVLDRLSGNTDLWDELKPQIARMLVLGNPAQAANHIKSILDGKAELLKLLQLVDGRDTDKIASIFNELPGLREMAASVPKAREDAFYIVGRDPADESTWNGSKTWFLNAAHGNVADHQIAFDAIRDVLATGKTTQLANKPFPAAVHEAVPRLYPSPFEILDAAFQADPDAATESPLIINAFVTHGHLRTAKFPVAVGHYQEDVVVSAEKVLDEQLGGGLSARFKIDRYPGPDGTSLVLEVEGAKPPGALVIGLGEVGRITAEKVRAGMTGVALDLALARKQTTGRTVDELVSVGISSVLLGTYGGNALSVRNSIAAILDGIVQANRTLRSAIPSGQVRIDQVEFVELYEDLAIQAARELTRLEERLREYADDGVVLHAERYLRHSPGGQFHRPASPYESGWWRRIEIAQKNGYFAFTSLTDRARAEKRDEKRQPGLVDGLVAETIATTAYDEDLSATLFELLLPNDLKEQMRDQTNVIFVVNETSAGYPWELLAQRSRKGVRPLSTQFGLLRQFTTRIFRQNVHSTRQLTAFVVGDPMNSHAELQSAQREAAEVAKILSDCHYDAKLLQRATASAVFRQFFARDYRIVHLAGHGQYDKDKLRNGVILSEGNFFTAAEMRQKQIIPELVFLNCCYLGAHREEDKKGLRDRRPNDLAASLAGELINMGVKAVIAAGWAVDDDAALTFATTFYKEMLIHGEKFGPAVLKARQETHRQHPGSNTWGAYQCYGNPDFSLLASEPQESLSGTADLDFVARQECLDRVRSINAAASGAKPAQIAELTVELERIESGVPVDWLDGELLSLVAGAYGSLGSFEQAIDSYRRALSDQKGTAAVKAVEQLANLLDRWGKKQPPAKQIDFWKEAGQLLDRIREWGPNYERLALSGALNKRMAFAEKPLNLELLNKAVGYYDEASNLYQRLQGEPYSYTIFNSIPLKLILSKSDHPFDRTKATQDIEAAMAATLKKAERTREIWDRVGEPDGLLLKYLLEGTLAQHQCEVAAKYKLVLDAATDLEKASILGQIELLSPHFEDVKALGSCLG